MLKNGTQNRLPHMPLDGSRVQLLFGLTMPWARLCPYTGRYVWLHGYTAARQRTEEVHQASSGIDPTSRIEALCQSGPSFLESRN